VRCAAAIVYSLTWPPVLFIKTRFQISLEKLNCIAYGLMFNPFHVAWIVGVRFLIANLIRAGAIRIIVETGAFEEGPVSHCRIS
jgi:hypothetical protein